MKKNNKRTVPETRVAKAWKAYIKILSRPIGGFLANRRSFRKHIVGPIAMSRPTPIFTSAATPLEV